MSCNAKQRRKPCSTCPFTMWCKPGETGGSHPSVFIGQSVGPFRIPCHEALDYSDPDWKTSEITDVAPQCVGNAIFRARIGVDQMMPEGILRVEPQDGDGVFDSMAGFFSFHTGISLQDAKDYLSPFTVRVMAVLEVSKAEVRILS